MNIFVLDLDPGLAAAYHNDKHVVKQVLETAQMLSTAIQVGGNIKIDGLYKPTHINRLCNIWARSSIHNFNWLYNLGMALCSEYTYRYGKTHKSEEIIILSSQWRGIIPNEYGTKFAQEMPEKYRSTSVVIAYRNYYMGEKRHLANWSKREVPYWWA